MSKPRYGWWAYAKYMARNYPALCKKAEELQKQSVTAAYGAQEGKASLPGRTTEAAALRQLPPAEQAELDAVRYAVELMASKPGSGPLRLRLIELVYWKRSHNLYGAAMRVHISEATAKRYNGEFLRAIAKARQLLD